MSAPKRDHLVETAQKIFGKHGFKGVSVDRLLAEAGVAKMTLYKGFKSKEALIAESLRRRDKSMFDWIDAYLAKEDPDPINRLLAYFDAIEAWSDTPDFNGCYFINALSEYGDDTDSEAVIAREHKQKMLEYVQTLCRDAGVQNPDDLAQDIRLLVEGATITKLSLRTVDSYKRAKQIAVKLIRET